MRNFVTFAKNLFHQPSLAVYNTSVRVLLDTHQLQTLSGFRGIGVYTDLLFKHLKMIPGLEVMLQDDGKPFDVIHYPYFDFFFHTLPIKKRAKTVVTIHDTIPLIFPDHYKPGIRGSLRCIQQKLSLLSVSAVLADSDASARDIEKYLGVSPKKVYTTLLAGNPLTQKQPMYVCNRVRLKYNLPDRYVLYVGDMNYNKNLPKFIQAFSLLPKPYHLVMVGRSLTNTSIPEGRALHATMQSSGAEQRIHILTGVPKDPVEDLAAIFTMAAVYIQPSLYEGFGLSVLDALQCGTPVVASNTSSLPEIGGDCALYINPHDEKDIALGMVKALRLSTKERVMLFERAEKHLEKFSWEKTAQQTYEVYKKVLNA